MGTAAVVVTPSFVGMVEATEEFVALTPVDGGGAVAWERRARAVGARSEGPAVPVAGVGAAPVPGNVGPDGNAEGVARCAGTEAPVVGSAVGVSGSDGTGAHTSWGSGTSPPFSVSVSTPGSPLGETIAGGALGGTIIGGSAPLFGGTTSGPLDGPAVTPVPSRVLAKAIVGAKAPATNANAPRRRRWRQSPMAELSAQRRSKLTERRPGGPPRSALSQPARVGLPSAAAKSREPSASAGHVDKCTTEVAGGVGAEKGDDPGHFRRRPDPLERNQRSKSFGPIRLTSGGVDLRVN